MAWLLHVSEFVPVHKVDYLLLAVSVLVGTVAVRAYPLALPQAMLLYVVLRALLARLLTLLVAQRVPPHSLCVMSHAEAELK